jgi:hypothetical protein
MAIYRYGDVNGDGVIDEFDSLLVRMEIAGLRKLYPSEVPRADVNRDAEITAKDAQTIFQHINGVELIYDTREE